MRAKAALLGGAIVLVSLAGQPATAQQLLDTTRLEFTDARSEAYDFALATYLEESGKSDIEFVAAEVDLNGDGRQDLVTSFNDPFYCGTGGCSLEVFIANKKGWKRGFVNGLSSPGDWWFAHYQQKNGYHLLAQLVANDVHYFEWDGEAYVPSDEQPGLDSPT
jgi:hypothetical protein